MGLNVLILDDDPWARLKLTNFVKNYYTQKKLNIYEAADISSALNIVSTMEEPLHIAFLDMELKSELGLHFAEILKSEPEKYSNVQFIFQTAYSDHAINAFEVNACDYILKPYSFERFSTAFSKALHNLSVYKAPAKALSGREVDKKSKQIIALKTSRGLKLLHPPRIYFMESLGNYTRIVTSDEEFEVYSSLSKLEKQFSGTYLVRIHRKYICNIDYMRGITSESVEFNNGMRVDISYRAYRRLLLAVKDFRAGKSSPSLVHDEEDSIEG